MNINITGSFELKKISFLLLVLVIFSIAACDTLEDTFEDEILDPDGLLTLEEINQQNFSLRTPVYNIQVAIDDDVDLPQDEILMLIDAEVSDFLNCQFFEGEDLGFDDFMLSNNEIITPLSDLRLFIVPFNFECSAQGRNICAGIYFSSTDSMAVAEEGFGRCGDLPLLKHEVAHRYGMFGDHSNQDEFAVCSDPEDCGLIGFLDDFGIGG